MEKEKKIKLPEAFVKKMEKLLGSDAEPFFESYDAERKFGLRVNPLKQKNGWTGRGGNASGRIPGRTCKSSLGEGRILLRGRYAPGTSSVP